MQKGKTDAGKNKTVQSLERALTIIDQKKPS